MDTVLAPTGRYCVRLPAESAHDKGEAIKSDLTIRSTDKYKPCMVRIYTQLTDDEYVYYYVPRYYGFLTFGPPAKLLLCQRDEPRTAPKFEGQLREYQVPLVCQLARSVKQFTTSVLQAPCADGKTVMGLYLISMVRYRTIIVVHRKGVLFQWYKEAQRFLSNIHIRIIGAGTTPAADVGSADLIICMVQSLTKEMIGRIGLQTLGLAIFDEVHHVAAPSYFKVLSRLYSIRYIVGMSATPRRSDGLDPLFCHSIGPIVASTTKERTFDIRVERVYVKLPTAEHLVVAGDDMGTYSKMEKALVTSSTWQRVVMETVLECCGRLPRGVLVLCLRVSSVRTLYFMTKKKLIAAGLKPCIFYGDLQDIDAAMAADVIFASIGLVKEAFNIPHLRSLILLSSISELMEQVLGRILRECPEEPRVFVDVYSNVHQMSIAMQKKRAAYMSGSGHRLTYVKRVIDMSE